MNKLEFINGEFNLIESDNLIEVSISDKYELFDIKKITIDVLGSTELEIIYKSVDETKLDIEYNISSNTKFKVTEIKEENKLKVCYKYNILENSNVDITKFYDANEVKEQDIISLNGVNSKVNYNFKTIAKEIQKYDIYIYHNYKKTTSNILNSSVNLDNGTTIFNVTSIVYNGIKKCNLNQINKIIEFNDTDSKIHSNILIEEDDTISDHKNYIGKFKNKEINELVSDKVSREKAINMLTKKFMLEKIKNKNIEKIVNKYWR